MPDPAVLHLTQIVESAQAIRSHLSGMDEKRFLSAPLHQDAVVMRLQVLGEAARRLTAAERAEAPEIDWNGIIAVRNRIAHNYRSIDFGIVWSIASTELDILQSAAHRMLAARGQGPP
jgi:uncharacterized protein with HEPN domain